MAAAIYAVAPSRRLRLSEDRSGVNSHAKHLPGTMRNNHSIVTMRNIVTISKWCKADMQITYQEHTTHTDLCVNYTYADLPLMHTHMRTRDELLVQSQVKSKLTEQ